MTDLAELERRIVAALARVDAGLDRLQGQTAASAQSAVAEAGQEGGSAPFAEPAEVAPSLAPVAEPSQEPGDLPLAEPVDDPRDRELAELQEALAAEKAQVAALMDRIRTLKGRESRNEANWQARVDHLTKQLDVQGLELHGLRKSMIQLREALRVMREGAEGGCVDAAMVNKAMLAELEALRAARSSETVELEEIIAELVALTGEEAVDA